ncbi:hypothetical protein ACXYTJ_00690 [Gilvimarinus sp. F26214L]|uniref:hypothetical protein n=1 Tax=Gilvimarinus sp. DZF01 TaxID=3461371 RepID=UPI0040459C7F
MGHAADKTRDHKLIQRWAEERGGHPAVVEGTEDKQDGAGLLRIKFDDSEENLKDIEWDEFFETFDDRRLTFLYQNEMEGKPSRFFKLIRE